VYLSNSNVAVHLHKLYPCRNLWLFPYEVQRARELLLAGIMFQRDTRLQKVQISKEKIVHYQECYQFGGSRSTQRYA
jgi:hypothetical protein